MKVRASLCTGINEPWTTHEIDIDEPRAKEVQVRMVYAGMCHSDEHLRTGDMSADPFTLELLGANSMFPCVGGHEGAGIIEAVGPGVTSVAVGDHIATSFIPSCGTCFWCASGRGHLCDLGITTLVGPMISDGTYRHHLNGMVLNRMTQLGTFAERMVVNEASVIKIDPEVNLKAAALISCGVSTGFGSVVDRAQTRPGEVVVIIGAGGVGSGAIYGARFAGAQAIVVIDPLEFKRDHALSLGATHAVASTLDAHFLVSELTRGRMADVVVLTPGVMTGDLVKPSCAMASKDGRIVLTGLGKFDDEAVTASLYNITVFNQTLMGSIFGSTSPRVQIPRLLSLHEAGKLDVERLISAEYALDDIQRGYDDLAAGKNIRGIVTFI